MPVSQYYCTVCWFSNCVSIFVQLFYSFFKSLVGKEVIVELKNDLWYVNLIVT